MTKIQVLDQRGKEQAETELNPAIFAAKINATLMAQAVRVRRENARLGTRKTKARGEVRGGGKKPWRQKGTGRARHGSMRSPIWVGGGHAHATAPVDYSSSLAKKQRRQALFSALTAKFSEGQIFVIDQLNLAKIKTRELKKALDNLKLEGTIMVVVPGKNEAVEKSARNIPGVKTLEARLLNTYDVLKHENILILRDSLRVLEETFL